MNISEVEGQTDSGNVEQFKSYLSSHPRIKTIVFSFTTVMHRQPSEYKPNFVHAAVDGENFFYRGIASPEAYLTKTERVLGSNHQPFVGPFVGRYDGKCFYVDNGLIMEAPEVPTTQSPRPDASETPSRRALPHLIKLDGLMNLGIWDVTLDSFAWSNNTFKALRGRASAISPVWQRIQTNGASAPGPEVKLNYLGQPISGTIEVAHGRVQKVRISEFPLSVRYEYSTPSPMPMGLPDKFSVYAGEDMTCKVQIYTLEFATEPIETSYFAPENYLSPDHYRTANSGQGVTIPDKAQEHEWIQAMKKADAPSAVKSAGWRALGVLIFAIALLAPPVYFFATRKT